MLTVTLPQTDIAQESAPRRKIVIAVDGPAASGKGTLARKIAERLGYAYLDTGALYRAVALGVLEIGGDPSDIEDARPAIDIVLRNMTLELLASPALRQPEVSAAASKVAALPEVRKALLAFQRDFAENQPADVGGAVLDGRDIGTVVCPDADVKFFVTAKAEERARRRFLELKRRHPQLTQETVLEDMLQRDRRDSGRAIAPAQPAEDAYLLDTTDLSPEAVLDAAIATVRGKLVAATDAVK